MVHQGSDLWGSRACARCGLDLAIHYWVAGYCVLISMWPVFRTSLYHRTTILFLTTKN
jgi:hypothetical protein